MSGAGRVFMLDDDKIFLDLYRHFLEAKGYEVFVTDNAYQFLMYSREMRPDLLFLDINMPRLNGWEVLNRITSDPILREIPTVMLSVNQDDELASLKGVAHFLPKPPAFEQLTDLVESYALGGVNHRLLLIEDYQPLFGQTTLAQCFVIHNLQAAKQYLRKNRPGKIAVRYTAERFEEARRELKRDDLLQLGPEDKAENLLGEE